MWWLNGFSSMKKAVFLVAQLLIMLCYAMLSQFSHVRLCVTPETAAHQAPPSLGFSRQEHWSGLPFPSPTLDHNDREKLESRTLGFG